MSEFIENPWKVLKSEEIYESPWIELTKHEVVDPGGQPGTYSVVHFKHLAIGIVPLDENMNTWIVGQYRFPLEKYTWELPEGGGLLDIPPLESAERELSEEVGIAAKKWTLIQEFYTSNASTDEKALIYVAQDLEFHEAHPDSDEDLQVKRIPFEELYQMVIRGEITDSLTIVGVLKTKELLRLKQL